MPGCAIGSNLPNHAERQVFRGHAFAQPATHQDQHGLRLALGHALRGQYMLDFGGPDAECQGSEGTVGAGVAVAADDGFSRLRQPQLRSDHVHNPLLGRVHIEQLHAEVFAILLQGCDLARCDRIGDRGPARLGRNVMVDGRHRALRLAHATAGCPQSVESLRRGDLVDQVQINVKQRRLPGGDTDHMLLPNLLE